MSNVIKIFGSYFRVDLVEGIDRGPDDEAHLYLAGRAEPIKFPYVDEASRDAAIEDAVREWRQFTDAVPPHIH